LVDYNPVVFLNDNEKEKYTRSNLKFSQNKNIITTLNPSILLTFYKEIELNKSLFSSSIPFEIHYIKDVNYEN
jgi:hypothetical protein